MTPHNESEKPQIATRPVLPATLLMIEPGTSATYDCRDLGKLRSVYAAISRLNQSAGWTQFAVSTEDNGATYTVSRAAAPTTIRRKQTDRSR